MDPSVAERSGAPAVAEPAVPESRRAVTSSARLQTIAARIPPATVLAWLILLVAVAAVAFPFWPGRMNADTLNEIASAKTGVYTNQYAPILEAIWRPFYNAGAGPGWILVGQLAMFAVGAYVILRRVFRPVGAAVAVLIITLMPQVYGSLALVGRDTWFLSLTVACFACLSRMLDARGRSRIAWAIAVVVFAWLDQAARLNAAAAIIVPLSLVAGIWLVDRRGQRRRLLLTLEAIAVGAIATLAIYGSQAAISSSMNIINISPAAPLKLYDLANISRIEGHDYIPKTTDPTGTIQWLDANTNVESDLALITGTALPVKWPIVGASDRALNKAWTKVVEDHPFAYLRERLHQMQWTLGLGVDQIWIYHPYIDANPFGYSTTFPGADNVANHWMQLFTDSVNNGGIIFAPWIFLLVCCVAVVLAARRQSPTRLVLGGIGLAMILYQIGFFFGLEGVNYRYEAPCVTMAMIIIAVALRRCWQWLRARSKAQAPRARKALVSSSESGVPIS
jgi:hypothetical protein